MENSKQKYIRIVNPVQAGAYVENNVIPIKIYWSKDKWVWLFKEEDTKEIWKLWRTRKL